MGYLRLVLSTTDYAAIPNTIPFVQTTNPDVFQYVPLSQQIVTTLTMTRLLNPSSGTPTSQRHQTSGTSTQTSTITINILHNRKLSMRSANKSASSVSW